MKVCHVKFPCEFYANYMYSSYIIICCYNEEKQRLTNSINMTNQQGIMRNTKKCIPNPSFHLACPLTVSPIVVASAVRISASNALLLMPHMLLMHVKVVDSAPVFMNI